MNKINYSQVYQKLTRGLSPKTKDIFDRRFGVKTGTPETLEAIGKTLGITRERVRQIEEAGFNFVRKQNKELLEAVFADFALYFKEKGGVQKEAAVLEQLGGLPRPLRRIEASGKAGKNQKPYVLFLLTIGDQFSRVCEKKDWHYFWSILENPQAKIKENLGFLVTDMQAIGKPVSKKDFYSAVLAKRGFSEEAMASYVDISKRIQENKDGKLGLIEWPEIKPRGVKDKAFLVFKKHGKPLHFTNVAKLIDELEYAQIGKKTYPQTVHNELIKDQRFVLVGRGTYALSEWGYVPGTIKDVIVRVLKDKNTPLLKDDIVKEVLAQRFVAKNTVLMNLNNKKHFAKDSAGKYFLKGTQSA